MGWCFAEPMRAADEHRDGDVLSRFDPVYWRVDFPRPMMAAVTVTAHDALRVTLAFTGRSALAGLIWDSADSVDHPLCAYATDRDYRRCKLSFHWQSQGVMPLDAVNGPVLTIEGRDADGQARTWYVRLWNYAVGSAEDAQIALDFGALQAGFMLPGEAQPVWAGDIDRLFIALVPPDYAGDGADYTQMQSAIVELSGIRCEGSGAVLRRMDAMLPGHGLSIATAYDDSYHVTPTRLLRQVEALGYDGPLLHYIGMSHYPALTRTPQGWRPTLTGGVLNGPTQAWHAALAAEAKQRDWTIIWSLSYELFGAYCPPEWMQRAANGDAALTGWVPPSALLSPANAEAMGYLAHVARAVVRFAAAAQTPVQVQIGEPWWWVLPDGRPCLYDASATAALGPVSVAIPTMRGAMTMAQREMLDAAGVLLAQSTAAISAAVRDEAGGGGVTLHLLIYLPTLFDPAMPELRRMALPLGWAEPAFDILQIEDYDWAARGQAGASAAGLAAVSARLGYPVAKQDYLAGFVASAADRAQWPSINAAAERAKARGVRATFIWALPQVARDGFVHFDSGEDVVEPFEDVDFPISVGRHASLLTEFSTAIVTGQSGAEQRSPDWNAARMRYDAGPGLRSEEDVRSLISFYRARRGPAIGFRFRDPMDASSAGGDAAPAASDELLGTGDGVRTDFALLRAYGGGPDAAVRRITRPVAGSVLVSINGQPVLTGWTVQPLGIVSFAVPPVAGAVIRAGFRFDVPVRFAEDRLEVSRATFLAGEMASVPLVEVREG